MILKKLFNYGCHNNDSHGEAIEPQSKKYIKVSEEMFSATKATKTNLYFFIKIEFFN